MMAPVELWWMDDRNKERRRSLSVSGRSYLLGNRKGIEGLKTKEREINQVYILKSKQQPIKNILEETWERVDIFSPSCAAYLFPAGARSVDIGPLKTLKLTWLSKPLCAERLIILCSFFKLCSDLTDKLTGIFFLIYTSHTPKSNDSSEVPASKLQADADLRTCAGLKMILNFWLILTQTDVSVKLNKASNVPDNC